MFMSHGAKRGFSSERTRNVHPRRESGVRDFLVEKTKGPFNMRMSL
jgi:hypothetical protein